MIAEPFPVQVDLGLWVLDLALMRLRWRRKGRDSLLQGVAVTSNHLGAVKDVKTHLGKKVRIDR